MYMNQHKNLQIPFGLHGFGTCLAISRMRILILVAENSYLFPVQSIRQIERSLQMHKTVHGKTCLLTASLIFVMTLAIYVPATCYGEDYICPLEVDVSPFQVNIDAEGCPITFECSPTRGTPIRKTHLFM